MSQDFKKKESEITDIKETQKYKEEKYRKLSEQKARLQEIHSQVAELELEDNVEKTVFKGLEEELETIQDQAAEIESELNEEIKILNGSYNEISEEIDKELLAHEKVKKTFERLDKIGLGGVMQDSLRESNMHIESLKELKNSNLQVEKDLSELRHKLNNI